MSTKKNKNIVIKIKGRILPGAISKAWGRCGKSTCRCRRGKKHRHGPYYRWTGWIKGKATTKTLDRTVAKECSKRIANYRKFQKAIAKELSKAIKSAPWVKNKS